jgi:hypothetical protein
MSEQKRLQPAEGAKVRHPDGRPLAPAGELVTMTSYWLRRIAAGDVVEVADAAPAAAVKGAGNGRDKGKPE